MNTFELLQVVAIGNGGRYEKKQNKVFRNGCYKNTMTYMQVFHFFINKNDHTYKVSKAFFSTFKEFVKNMYVKNFFKYISIKYKF